MTGMVTFIALALVIGAGGAWLAHTLHIDDGPIVAILCGVAITLAVAFRWWPFWWHAKALLVRSILGDRGATAFYIVFGVGLVVWGGLRVRDWRADAVICRGLYLAARTSQDRIRALNHVPRLGSSTGPGHKSPTGRTCARYRDFGGF